MIKCPNMLMIGSAQRKIGKTELACRLIERHRELHDVIGIKVTTILEADGECPHGGGEGCGTCTSFEGEYEMSEENSSGLPGKDTVRMLQAGATRVLWLRVLKDHLEDAISALLETIDSDAALICESNSLRNVVEPGLFIMVEDETGEYKPSASDMKHHADRVIRFDGKRFDFDEDEITFAGGVWALPEPATAIIMAGGKSARMGQDKGMLPIEGRPMIQYIADKLRPHFAKMMVSANDAERYSFLGLDVVPDRIPGLGPLMGLASALEASACDVNFVIACDVPGVDIAFVRRMLRECKEYDGVVPVTGIDHLEPMCAVYHKSILEAIETALSSGENRIKYMLKNCHIKYIEVDDPVPFWNINTADDYKTYLSRKAGNKNEKEPG